MFSFQRIWEILVSNQELIIAGIISTVILSVFGTIVGLILGVFIAYGKNLKPKQSDNKFKVFWINVLKGLCTAYSVVLRGTPMMVQALIFKYGCAGLGLNWDMIRFVPQINNVFNGWFIAGLIVITFNTAAYMAEIVQSGLNGVDKGQIEGARTLGMKSSETSLYVILPQAIRNALPTIGNELIVNIKDSSVLNVIATTELYFRINMISVRTYAFLEGYVLLAVIYLLMTLCASVILKLVEQKLDGKKISLNPFGRLRRKSL